MKSWETEKRNIKGATGNRRRLLRDKIAESRIVKIQNLKKQRRKQKKNQKFLEGRKNRKVFEKKKMALRIALSTSTAWQRHSITKILRFKAIQAQPDHSSTFLSDSNFAENLCLLR